MAKFFSIGTRIAKHACFSAVLSHGLAGGVCAQDSSGVKYLPISIALLEEFGQLKSGRFASAQPFNDEWVDHFGAFITQGVEVSERLSMNVGIGGLFQFQKPEVVGTQWGGTQTKYFFVGPTVAEVVYRTPTEKGSWSLGAGMFGFKYNPDAADLGEYLFRANAYPTYILSGRYSFVNGSTVYGLQGFKGNYTRGGLSADMLLLTETTLAPLYDLSLAGVLKYKTPQGMFSAFGGANLSHIVPVRPSKTNRKSADNSYFKGPAGGPDGEWYTGNIEYYREQVAFNERMAAKAADPTAYQQQATRFQAIVDSLARPVAATATEPGSPGGLWMDSASGLPRGAKFFSLESVILTAGAAIDFKPLFGSSIFGPEDLRLFTEASLLGVRDYELFYQDKLKRMPIMVGFNFPGFRFLDLISLQYEYFNSPWVNSYAPQASGTLAVPAFPLGIDEHNSQSAYNDAAKHDNHSWSVLVRKNLVKGLAVNLQVARDHIRSVAEKTYAGPGTDPNELLFRDKDWYWMLQFSAGI